MLVKDVIALAAETLGLASVANELNGALVSPSADARALLRCYNIIENEVALDFFPLKAEAELTPAEGRIAYKDFPSAPVHIYGVEDAGGVPVQFAIRPTYLSVPEGKGRLKVAYAYAPEEKTLADETAFAGNISARLLAYGVVSEYLLVHRKFSEGAMWGRRYRDALRAAGIFRGTLSVRSRRWL